MTSFFVVFIICCVVMVFLLLRHNDADIPFTQLLFFHSINNGHSHSHSIYRRWLCVPITLNFKWIYFTELECRIRILCCVFHFPSHLSLINTRIREREYIYLIHQISHSSNFVDSFELIIFISDGIRIWIVVDAFHCLFYFLWCFISQLNWTGPNAKSSAGPRVASRTATNGENPSVAIKFLIHPHHFVILTWIVFKTDFLLFSARQLPNSSITF